MLKGMAGFQGFGFSPAMQWQVVPDRLAVLAIGVALVYAMPWLRRHSGAWAGYVLIALFVWAVATLSAQAFTPFLYFQF